MVDRPSVTLLQLSRIRVLRPVGFHRQRNDADHCRVTPSLLKSAEPTVNWFNYWARNLDTPSMRPSYTTVKSSSRFRSRVMFESGSRPKQSRFFRRVSRDTDLTLRPCRLRLHCWKGTRTRLR